MKCNNLFSAVSFSTLFDYTHDCGKNQIAFYDQVVQKTVWLKVGVKLWHSTVCNVV